MGSSRNDPVVLMGAGHAEALGLLEMEAPEGPLTIRIEADGLEPAELAAAILRRLRVDREAPDPWHRLEEAVRALGDDGLLLLVSGASGMRVPAAAALRRSIDRLAGNLRVVLAMGPPKEAVLAELAPIAGEIQVGVLGPKPSAVRARRWLASPLAGGRSSGPVTMAQLAKARRRRTPGPEQGFITPGRAPAEPGPRPAGSPEKPGLAPAGTPSPARDDVGRQARAPLQRRDPPAPEPAEKPQAPRVGWRRTFTGLAATLMAMGSVWWALGPEPSIDRAGGRDPVRNGSTRERPIPERRPEVSLGPPPTQTAVEPRPDEQVREGRTPARQAPSPGIVEDSVEAPPRAQRQRAAPDEPAPARQAVVAASDDDATGTPLEYAPPIVRNPGRVPEILRIGPPSSGADATPADESGAPGSVDADIVLVGIDAEPLAHIRVDGRLLGRTPIVDARIPEGLHSFSIEFENGQTSERSVRVDAANQSFLFRLVPSGSRSPPPPGD